MTGAEAASFDAVVIGAGSGGLTVAFGLARVGRRVALVEADAVGGDCTNVGCIPSKALLQASAALSAGGRGPGDPGWADAAAGVLAHVRAKRDALRDRETAEVLAEPNLTLFHGRAMLLAADRVRVTPGAGAHHEAALELRAPVVVIATGARPATIELPGLPAATTLTNATLFDLQAPPAHLAVIGGGAIGAEMATAFARLGSRVTLLEALPRLLPASPAAAAELVTRALRARGVDVRLGARVARFDVAEGALWVDGTGSAEAAAGAAHPVEGVDRVLMAVGRRPNVEGLGLEALGVRIEGGGIATDAAHRTSVRGVYAIGDVTPRAHFTHAANAQGRRLVRHLLAPWLPLVPEGAYPSATFTDPEVAQIGPDLSTLQRRYGTELVVTHRVDLAALDRGYVSDVGAGFIEVHALRFTGRLLAATVVGPNAAEIVQLATWLQRRRGTLWQLSRHLVAYPALSEGLKKVADAFVFATLPALPREFTTYLRHRWRPRPR